MSELSEELSDFIFDFSDRSLFVDGELLVVPHLSRLPPICVRTARPVTDDDMIRQIFYWAPAAAGFLLLAAVPGWIAYFAMRKRCTITYAMHRSVRNKYRMWFVNKFLAMLALLVSIPLAITYTSSAWVITFVITAFFVSLIALALGNRPIRVKKHMNGKFWFAGCSPEYLAMVSQFEG
jgi:hypothetical protein